ncbi:hypothetical protein [Caldicellulosiruptor morganii]|uniref:Uncharacterized protein n=1 Tax=Caldicellulosiruptor morganii TaxID=1387555 RepID=A0ABY7BP27_9FIRM|nr:hypothetical protein [Caldicellulosiruptor morganii]WAM33647.1 hypothetical protein OTK00_002168 [Caldicellulosiruptor morganii]
MRELLIKCLHAESEMELWEEACFYVFNKKAIKGKLSKEEEKK